MALPEVMDADKRAHLIDLYQALGDPLIRRQIVRGNLRFIRYTIERMTTATYDEDLLQAGTIGMIKAVDAFDADKGANFLTYAAYHIRAEVYKQINHQAHHTYVPLYAGQQYANAQTEDPKEVAAEDNKLNEQSARAVKQARRPSSFDTISDVLPGRPSDTEEVEFQLALQKLCKRFATRLDDPRNRAIWFERLMALDPKTLQELGDSWSVTRERIRQIEEDIKQRFRRFIKKEEGSFVFE